MPPHGHGGGHHGGGGWGGPGWWGPGWTGGGDTIIVDPGCTGYDLQGRAIRVPCTDVLGDDAVDDEPTTIPDVDPPTPILRTALNLASGRKAGGSTPYYSFAAQARSYPFDWHGRPGGVPAGHRAGESSELSGGDLLESGLNPYAMAYPPTAGRGFRHGPPSAFSGLTDLSDSEKQLLTIGAVAAGAYLLWRHSRKGRRR